MNSNIIKLIATLDNVDIQNWYLFMLIYLFITNI